MTHEKRMLNPEEASEYVGLAAGTLANMRTRGDGPKFRKIAGRIRYDRQDIDIWIESHVLVVSTSDGA
jgi:predicted DNA-binding transcriptional regulator AlpA